ncbi:hypothetical protein ACET3Z_031707 [Daucus carota]
MITISNSCEPHRLVQINCHVEASHLGQQTDEDKKADRMLTMTSSFLGSAVVAAATKQPSVAARPSSVVMAKASNLTSDRIQVSNKSEESGNGRREMMFAFAAAAACSVANIALAEEPKRGSAEAKKKYAQVCVTMPTARICRN